MNKKSKKIKEIKKVYCQDCNRVNDCLCLVCDIEECEGCSQYVECVHAQTDNINLKEEESNNQVDFFSDDYVAKTQNTVDTFEVIEIESISLSQETTDQSNESISEENFEKSQKKAKSSSKKGKNEKQSLQKEDEVVECANTNQDKNLTSNSNMSQKGDCIDASNLKIETQKIVDMLFEVRQLIETNVGEDREKFEQANRESKEILLEIVELIKNRECQSKILEALSSKEQKIDSVSTFISENFQKFNDTMQENRIFILGELQKNDQREVCSNILQFSEQNNLALQEIALKQKEDSLLFKTVEVNTQVTMDKLDSNKESIIEVALTAEDILDKTMKLLSEYERTSAVMKNEILKCLQDNRDLINDKLSESLSSEMHQEKRINELSLITDELSNKVSKYLNDFSDFSNKLFNDVASCYQQINDKLDTNAKEHTILSQGETLMDIKNQNQESKELIDSLSSKIDNLSNQFDTKIKYDENQRKIIDNLHEELSKLRGNLYASMMTGVFQDLCAVRDSITKTVEAYKEKRSDEQNIPLRTFSFFADDIMDILESNAVSEFSSEVGSKYIPVTQKAVKKIPTNDESLHATIFECRGCGYMYNDKVLVPEKVAVYYFVANKEE